MSVNPVLKAEEKKEASIMTDMEYGGPIPNVMKHRKRYPPWTGTLIDHQLFE